jgi:hypothetical protein
MLMLTKEYYTNIIKDEALRVARGLPLLVEHLCFSGIITTYSFREDAMRRTLSRGFSLGIATARRRAQTCMVAAVLFAACRAERETTGPVSPAIRGGGAMTVQGSSSSSMESLTIWFRSNPAS